MVTLRQAEGRATLLATGCRPPPSSDCIPPEPSILQLPLLPLGISTFRSAPLEAKGTSEKSSAQRRRGLGWGRETDVLGWEASWHLKEVSSEQLLCAGPVYIHIFNLHNHPICEAQGEERTCW